MKTIKQFLFLFSVLFLLSCAKDDGKISFTVLQLNDVYEIAAIQGGKYGGMARVETVRQELLKKDPNTMTVIAGDFLNPSLVGTMKYEGKKISGRQMIEVMNTMDFDVAAFGNHEFDVKEKELQERMDESHFPWISANIFGRKIDSVKGDSLFVFHQNLKGKRVPVKGSFIKEISDADGTKIKIGFISVCIPSNPKDYVYYTDMYDAIEKEYETIKDAVDIVLGLTHVKVEEDSEIAKRLPNIPLIMGGHEHTKKDVTVGNVLIKKADANAKSVYIHTIDYNKNEKKTIVSSEYKLINEDIAYEPNVKRIVDKWQDIMDKEITNVVDNPYDTIYYAKEPLDGRDTPTRSIQTNLGEMITKGMSFAYDNKVDCAIINGGTIRIDDKLKGYINSVDIFRVLPFGGTVVYVEMKGSLLKKVLDFGVEASGSGAYLQRYNADYDTSTNTWMIDGKKIDNSQNYKVAISDYLLLGLDIDFLDRKTPGIISIKDPKEDELAFDIRKGVIEYMKTLYKK